MAARSGDATVATQHDGEFQELADREQTESRSARRSELLCVRVFVGCWRLKTWKIGK